MKVEINTANSVTKAQQTKELLQEFIDFKMERFVESPLGKLLRCESGYPQRTKYFASLWMVPGIMNIMDDHKISKASGISLELLSRWRQEEEFNQVVQSNYREFLEYVIDLLG